MSEEKPELMTLVWKLYNLALRLAEELEEPELDEKQRKWKFDALSKVTSPLVKLLQMALEEGEVKEDDLVKLLSGLSAKGLMSFEEMYSVFEKRIEETRLFLLAVRRYAEENNRLDIVEDVDSCLDDLERFRIRVKFVSSR